MQFNNAAHTAELAQTLLDWFDQYGRHDLPWQQEKTPYRVWVSEIMLQQTQVQTVIPYFERFMQRFPMVAALAEASQEAVLSHWAGLGYYARGRNLHQAAQIIMTEHGGEFPTTFDDIVALPGIGRSTAGAILSIVLKQRFPILDGNVKRVLARLEAVPTWTGEKRTEETLWQWAEALTPDKRFDDYTQAIMDLGATVCRRSRPNCEQCPWQSHCVAYQQKAVSDYPKSKPKKVQPERWSVFAVLENERGEIFLQQRPQTGIWGGMWSLPQSALQTGKPFFKQGKLGDEGVQSLLELLKMNKACLSVEKGQRLPAFRHTFTHYHLWLQPIKWQVDQQTMGSDKGCWVSLEQALALGLPAPIKQIVESLQDE